MADSTIPFKKIPIKHKDKIVYALVDIEDYPVLSRHTWHLTGPKLYPATFLELEDEKRRIVSMHRMILGGVADLDHEDNVSLNNRKYNLRRATTQQNGWNKGKPKGGRFGKPSSQYKGVSRCVAKDGTVYWRVIIKTTAKGVKPAHHIRRGPFNSEVEAAKIYNEEIVKLRGEWAWVNEITQDYAHNHTVVSNCTLYSNPDYKDPIEEGFIEANPTLHSDAKAKYDSENIHRTKNWEDLEQWERDKYIEQATQNSMYCRCPINGKPSGKFVNASSNTAYCGNCKKQFEPEYPTQHRNELCTENATGAHAIQNPKALFSIAIPKPEDVNEDGSIKLTEKDKPTKTSDA